MAGFLAKSVYRTAKFAVKYVVIPIAYTAFLGYLMQEAADRIRQEGGDPEEKGDAPVMQHEPAFDPTLRPSR